MATYISDNFTGSAGAFLTTYNSSWRLYPFGVGDNPVQGGTSDSARISNSQRVRRGGSTGGYAHYLYNFSIPTADYTVTADVVILSVGSPSLAAIMGRMVDTQINANSTFYRVQLLSTSAFAANFVLSKTVNGSETSLASVSKAISAGNTYNLKLEMSGTSLKAYFNNSLIHSVTDSSISAAGNSGIRIDFNASTDGSGFHVDNFRTADNFSEKIITPSGGITFSGTGNQIDFRDPNHIIPAGGIILFSGTGNQANTSVPPYIIEPEGGIVFSGTGNILNEKSPPHIILTSGGVVFGGSAPMLFNYEPPIGGGPRMPLTGVGL